MTHLNQVFVGLGTYFYPVNALSKQKRAMRHGMSRPRELKVRRYTDRLIYINDYLYAYPGEKAKDNIIDTELSKILLNSMPNGWSKQAYMQGFDL